MLFSAEQAFVGRDEKRPSLKTPAWEANWRPVTEESQLNARARAGKQIKLFMFLFICFLVWPYNKHLINRARSVCMGESWPRSLVQTSLRLVCTGDLGQHSPLQTSVWLIRAKICYCTVSFGPKLPRTRYWVCFSPLKPGNWARVLLT